MMSACPEQSQLVEWLEAAIGEEDRARIESHISSCPACQQKLEHISAHFEETRTMLHSEQATTRNQLNSELVARIADLLAVPQPRTAAPPGDFPKITGYEIQKMIAHGGMGVVYLARQTAANRLVALKLMLHGSTSTQEEVQRFQIESRAAARLTHQYIVPIYEVGTSNERPFFTMGYVNGSSLKQLLDAGPLPCREAAEIVMQMACAINYAHQEGVLHRDLKPGNILIDREGRPHLTDFGLAKLAEENEDLTLTGQILGTPSYMAPEQARGDLSQIGPATDLYALGAVLYATLTGQAPFVAANTLDLLKLVVESPVTSPRVLQPHVDRDLETICLKCLEKQQENRFASAADLQREFQRYLEGVPIRSRPISVLAKAWRWCVRQPVMAGLIAAFVLSLSVGTIVSSYFAILANVRAERAEQGTRIALSTLETIINTVQSKLTSIPGARRVRRELLTSTLADLELIMGDVSFSDRIDQDLGRVYIDMGNLYVELGDVGGEKADAQADRCFREAITLFRALRLNESDDIDHQLEYSRSLQQYSNFLNLIRKPQEAEPLLKEALQIRRNLFASHPEDFRVKRYLIRSIISMADCYMYQKRPELGYELIPEGVKLAKELDAVEPENEENIRELLRCLAAWGDMSLDSGRLEEAFEHYQEHLHYVDIYAARFPGRVATADEYSLVHERIGLYWDKKNDQPQALIHFQKMFDYVNEAIEMDPDDRLLKEALATACDQLAITHRKLGNQELSRQFAEQRDEIDTWLSYTRD